MALKAIWSEFAELQLDEIFEYWQKNSSFNKKQKRISRKGKIRFLCFY